MEDRDWEAIRTLQAESHGNSVAKGFYEGVDLSQKELIGNKLLLVVGEVIEAHEEIRAGIDPTLTYYVEGKPEGVPSELADVMIRVLDLAGALKIDLASAIQVKSEFNATRGYKHGKQF